MQLNFQEHGVEIRTNQISNDSIAIIKNEIEQSKNISFKHGIRNANKKFKSLAESSKFLQLAAELLGSHAKLVRVIYFDKTSDKNWLVTWHQDKTISLNKKMELPGWEPWSIKDSVRHVQPPVDILNKMITFRLHLDDSGKYNGCLKVIPKSHKLGKSTQQEVLEVVASNQAYYCEVVSGDLVIMRPHILHASDKSSSSEHRRVVHIEYSNYSLPEQLKWLQ